jgi:thymidylate kinase
MTVGDVGRGSIVVEFVGLPGSGKSTLAAATLHGLRAAAMTCDDLLEPVAPTVPTARRLVGKAWRCASEVVLHPRQSMRLVAGIRASGQRGGDLVHRTESWLVVRAVVRSARRRPGVHLIDQGRLQEHCSVALHGDWRVDLPGDDRAPETEPDLVVDIRVDAATASKRLDARPGTQSRLERLTGRDRLLALARQRDDLDGIIASARMRTGDRTIWLAVDGTTDPERSAAEVIREIRRLLVERSNQETGSSTASPRDDS